MLDFFRETLYGANNLNFRMAENTEKEQAFKEQAFIVLEDNGVNRAVIKSMLQWGLGIEDPLAMLEGTADEEDDFLKATEVINNCRGKVAMILDHQTPTGGASVFLRKVVDGIRSRLLETVDRTLVVFPNTSMSGEDLRKIRAHLGKICAEYPETLKMGDNLGKPLTTERLCEALLNADFHVPNNILNQRQEEPEHDDGPSTSTKDLTAEAAIDKIEKALPILISQLEALRVSALTRQQKRAELRRILNEIIDLWDSASSKLPQKGAGRLIKIMFHTVKGYAYQIRQSVAEIREIDDMATNLIEILEATKYKAPNTEVTLSSPMPAFDRLHTYYAKVKGVYFRSMPTALPATAIDPWHIQIAIMNLISNAQLAGADSVEVSVTQEGNNIKVTVSDNGRPFPADWTPEEALQEEGRQTGNGLPDIKFLEMDLDFAEYRGKAGIRARLQRLWLQWKGAPYPKAISILIPTGAENSLVKA